MSALYTVVLWAADRCSSAGALLHLIATSLSFPRFSVFLENHEGLLPPSCGFWHFGTPFYLASAEKIGVDRSISMLETLAASSATNMIVNMSTPGADYTAGYVDVQDRYYADADGGDYADARAKANALE